MADDIRRLSEELARDPQSMAFLSLGEGLRRQGQLEHALKIALRGLERHPHLADAHDLLARVYADRRELEKAFDEWDMVRRLAPGHAGAAKGLGFIYFHRGELEEAERLLREALEGNPGDASIGAALALVRQETGASDGAPAPAAELPAPEAMPPRAADEPLPPAAVRTDQGAAPRADDPRFLFAGILPDHDQTALMLDREGFVLAGAYYTEDGSDIAQEIGAELSGVSDEATRAARHLGIGAWRSITFEAEAATVAMTPTRNEGLVVIAAGGSTPLGLTKRLLERCAVTANAWLDGGA